jgi:hypothetical protein
VTQQEPEPETPVQTPATQPITPGLAFLALIAAVILILLRRLSSQRRGKSDAPDASNEEG